jgi:hypothetical protein
MAFVAPTVQRGAGEVLEAACGSANVNTSNRRGDQRHIQVDIAREAAYEVHAIGLAPRYQQLTGEAGTAAQKKTHSRPAATELHNNVSDFPPPKALAAHRHSCDAILPTADVATEDIERQVAAVAIGIAVEELGRVVNCLACRRK